MILDKDAEDVLLLVFVGDIDERPVLDVPHDAAGLAVEWRRPDTGWVPITLVAGSLGVYTAGGWAQDSGGMYQLGLPASAVLPGQRVFVRVTHGGRTSVPAVVAFVGASSDAAAARAVVESIDGRLPAQPAAVGDLPDVAGLATGADVAAAQAAANAAVSAAQAATTAAAAARDAAESIDGRLPAQPAAVGNVGLTPTQSQQLGVIAGAVSGAGLKVTVASPVAEDGDSIELVRGDWYAAADGRALIWTLAGRSLNPGTTTAALTLIDAQGEGDPVGAAGTVANLPDGDTTLTFELIGSDTGALRLGTDRYTFDAQVTADGRAQTVARGRVTVLEQSTP